MSIELKRAVDWGRRRLAELLRPRDQSVVAAISVVAVVVLVATWLTGGWTFSDTVPLDAAPHQTARFVVDINHAGWPEIAQLPGVGETIARRIVESREHDGPFNSVADLRRVHGLGKRTLSQIKPYLLPPPSPSSSQ